MNLFRILLAAMFSLALADARSGTVVDTYISTVNNVPILPDNGCLDDANGLGEGGIINSITIPAGDLGSIVDVNVQVAMTHTWRGDIQMSLTDGTTTVLLANNHGGSADNYHATFDTQAALPCSDATNCGGAANCNTPPGPTCQPNQVLDAFNGAEAAGRTFTLQICDRAAGDLGTLVNWAIEVEREPPGTVVSGIYPSTVNNVPILPDNGCVNDAGAGLGAGGISNAITIPPGDTGSILDVNVQVQITQTWRGDLQMALSDGTSTVLLANNHGGSADNYFATFDTQAAEACSAAANCGGAANCVTAPGPICQPNELLDVFNGEEAGGRTFTLHICDRATGDLGTLLNWTLLVDREGAGVVEADLAVTLADAPDPVTAGNNLTYTVTTTNNGPDDADNMSIELPLPAGTSFVSVIGGTGSACNAASPVTCTWAGPTASGASRVAVIVAAVDASATGTLNATATTTSDTVDPDASNNSADATTGIVVDADVGIAKAATTVPDPLLVGETIVYTLTASNAGPSTATDVVVSDTLPANLDYVSNSCGAAFAAPTLTWTIGTLAVGASLDCTLTVTVADIGDVVNTATISASSGDSNAANNTGTAALGVAGLPLPEAVPVPASDAFGRMLLALMVVLLGLVILKRRH